MAQRTGRREIYAYLSDTAHEGWRDFAAEQGVSVSAILESLAPELVRLEDDRSVLDTVVDDARRIDAERRRRI